MDFKNYVKLMLEAEKAEDQDNEKAEDQDEDEDEDSDDEEDEDKEASVRTGCNGCEASADTDDEEDSDDEEDDEDEDSDDEDEEKTCSTKKSLKESILYSSRYACGTLNESVMTEETRVMVEGINNNSASKYLAKLAKRADKEYAKYTKKGAKEAAATAKKAASSLKEASAKLYKCETRYQAGDVSAKKEYKKICKQYSKELKEMGRGVKGFKNLIFTLLAGAVLLGGIGITAASNDDVIDKLNYGFHNAEKMPAILKQMAGNDGKAIAAIVKNIGKGQYEDVAGAAKETAHQLKGGATTEAGFAAEEGFKRIGHNAKEVVGKAKEALKDTAAHSKDDWNDKFGTKADWEAQKDDYMDAEEQEKYEGWSRDAAKKVKETGEKIAKGVKGTGRGIAKGFTGTFKGMKKGFKGE